MEHPTLTISEVANIIQKSDSATQRAMRMLREANLLERVGPAKGGYWKVMVDDE